MKCFCLSWIFSHSYIYVISVFISKLCSKKREKNHLLVSVYFCLYIKNCLNSPSPPCHIINMCVFLSLLENAGYSGFMTFQDMFPCFSELVTSFLFIVKMQFVWMVVIHQANPSLFILLSGSSLRDLCIVFALTVTEKWNILCD